MHIFLLETHLLLETFVNKSTLIRSIFNVFIVSVICTTIVDRPFAQGVLCYPRIPNQQYVRQYKHHLNCSMMMMMMDSLESLTKFIWLIIFHSPYHCLRSIFYSQYFLQKTGKFRLKEKVIPSKKEVTQSCTSVWLFLYGTFFYTVYSPYTLKQFI